eukprot:1158862-Pelagomonas_calceolata.AAC.4
MVTLGTLRTKVCREGSRGQFRAILYSRIRGCKGRAVLMHAWMQRGRLQEDLRLIVDNVAEGCLVPVAAVIKGVLCAFTPTR